MIKELKCPCCEKRFQIEFCSKGYICPRCRVGFGGYSKITSYWQTRYRPLGHNIVKVK